MADRYWVGNGGSWTQTAHWSTTSGGAGGASVPTSSDNAFFDANSFTLTGQTINFGSYGSLNSVNNISLVGVTNSPTLSNFLHVYGDLTLSTGIDSASSPEFFFEGISNIYPNGATFCGEITLGGNLTYSSPTVTLQGDLDINFYGGIGIYGGIFDSNNYNINAYYFYANGGGGGPISQGYINAYTTVRMGTSSLTVYDSIDFYEEFSYDDPTSQYGSLNVDFSNATLILTNPQNGNINFSIDIVSRDITIKNLICNLDDYNYVLFDSGQSYYSLTLDTADLITFNIENLTVTKTSDPSADVGIYFLAGHIYRIENLVMEGVSTVDGPNGFGTVYVDWTWGDNYSDVSYATLEVNTSVDVSYVEMYDNHISGDAPSFIANNSIDAGGVGGGNVGWTFPDTIIPSMYLAQYITVSESVNVEIGETRYINEFETVTITESFSKSSTTFPPYITSSANPTRETITVSESVSLERSIPVAAENTTRYWVGGSGYWEDPNHWSETSGGSACASAPFGYAETVGGNYRRVAFNNVVFDANSFSSNGNTVTITQESYALNFDMSGVDQTFTIDGGDNDTPIYVLGGTVTLSSFFTYDAGGTFRATLGSTNPEYTQLDFTFANATFTADCGGLTIGNERDVYDSSYVLNVYLLDTIDMPDADLSFYMGRPTTIFTSTEMYLYTNNNDITAYSLSSGGNNSTPLIYAGTSTFNINGGSLATGPEYWDGANAIINLTATTDRDFTILAESGPLIVDEFNILKGNGIAEINAFSNISLAPVSVEITSNTFTIEAGTEVTFNYEDAGQSWSPDNTDIITDVFYAVGSPSEIITIGPTDIIGGPNPTITITANTATVGYIDVSYSTAAGNVPFDARVGGVDSGNNTDWLFDITNLSVYDQVSVFERRADSGPYSISPGSLIQTNLNVTPGIEYRLSFTVDDLSGVGGQIIVSQGTQSLYTILPAMDGAISLDFTADSSGESISFAPNSLMVGGIIDNVSLREIKHPAVEDNLPIKEFLDGETDEGEPIQFRVDLKPIQLGKLFEKYSEPVAVINRVQRGSEMKCFVSLNDEDFYQLEGNAEKGVSIMKVHNRDKRTKQSLAQARKIQISLRDNSYQLCRLVQTAIIFNQGNIESGE